MSTPTFTDVLRIEVAALQAAHPDRLGEIARAHAMIVEGHVVDTHDGNGKVLSRNGHAWYTVNGTCECRAAEFGKHCRHMSAWRLYRHIQKKWEAMHPDDTPAAEPEPTPGAPSADPVATAGIDPRFLTHIHGKAFVQYAGLLAMAHTRGLISLSAAFISVTPELALAEAKAIFRDGTEWTEAADASPENVPPHIRPHFARLALTRAKARCLRDALNIAMAAVEELAD